MIFNFPLLYMTQCREYFTDWVFKTLPFTENLLVQIWQNVFSKYLKQGTDQVHDLIRYSWYTAPLMNHQILVVGGKEISAKLQINKISI